MRFKLWILIIMFVYQKNQVRKMKRIFTVLLVLSIEILAQYNTPGTGVNWGPDDLVANSGGIVTGAYPDYEISALVTVSETDIINIPAGSTLNFTGSDAGFEVDGTLTISGVPGNEVVLTSPSADSTGAWEGIRFNDTSPDDQCIIEYAKINYAYYGMRAVDASPTLMNSDLFMCRRGVQLSGSDMTIQNNTIIRSYEYGITLTLDSSPLIEGNELFNNNTQDQSAKNQISAGLQGNNSPVIINNVIHGGSSTVTGGISIWVNGSSAYSNAIIEGNEIYDNSFGITLYSTSDGQVNAVVRGNKIYNNTMNPNPMVAGSGININGSPNNKPLISWNNITGNYWGITVMNSTTVQAGPEPLLGNIENADTTDDGNNIIMDNIQGEQVYDLYNNCTNNLYAQNNDWGVYDSLSIEEHIFHKNDDPAHGTVYYMPFSNPIVPVELISFRATNSVESVLIEWETASELNNLEFRILRNGDLAGTISGKGTSSEITRYSFVDNYPYEGANRYVLLQVDFNGEINRVAESVVDFSSEPQFILFGNYPNPFNPETRISFSLQRESDLTLKVYNLSGELVMENLFRNMSPGKNELMFNGEKLSSGTYIYQIITGENSAHGKFMLLK